MDHDTSPPYPDNIMPARIYRKSIRETRAYAKAETRAKAKSFIPKYGETAAFTLEANFAIKLVDKFLRDYVHARYASITNGQLSMPCSPIVFCIYIFKVLLSLFLSRD